MSNRIHIKPTYFNLNYKKNDKREMFFRISHKCVNSVKRNKIKRIIREFLDKHFPYFRYMFIFHVQKHHLMKSGSWREYIKGLQNDLENMLVGFQNMGKNFFAGPGMTYLSKLLY